MTEFTTRNPAILSGSALVAFGLLYWALNVELGAAIGITAVYAVGALVIMYFKSRTSP